MGGGFTQIAGVSASRIAWWDGTAMHPFGAGLNNAVYVSRPWNSNIVAGGLFTASGATPASRIAIWNGSAWYEPGPGGMNAAVNALAVHDGCLIAGGDFATAGGITVNKIARWDGTQWTSLAGGMNGNVNGLCSTASGLYAGGWFTQAGGVPVNRMARWDGAAWHDVGGGMLHDDYLPWVNVIMESDSLLYAGGYFTEAGGQEGIHLARWNGTTWTSPMSNSGNGLFGNTGPYAMAVFQGGLIVGGAFTRAGGQRVDYLARWNGLSWSGLGGFNAGVGTLLVHDDLLYAGGDFTLAGGVPVSDLAAWDGVTWQPVGSGTDGYVLGLGEWNGDLYVGGNFTQIGGVPANGVARWDGATFTALGSGVGNFVYGVYAFGVFNNELVVGGDFKLAGGSSAKAIAKWNGSTWSPLGGGIDESRIGFTPTVYAMRVYNEDLIAAGCFTLAGGNPANFVAKWNGSSWSTLGSGVGTTAYALNEYNENLIVSGFFNSAGGMTVNHIAAWNGTSWSAFGSGMDGGWVRTLGIYGGSLYAGGVSNYAGLKSSLGIARWTDPTSSVPEAPRLRIVGAFPNPFRTRTTLAYELPLPGSYCLRVYDVQGRRIRTLADRFMSAGPWEIEWDGRDAAGLSSGPGVYFLRLAGPAGSRSKKVIRVP